MIKYILILFISLLSAVNLSAQTDPRPNIVILFADDLGYSDIGCYGGEIETPNLDKLAENGIRLTQFMNCSKCAPSRATLLTGLYPLETGCVGPPDQMVNGVTIAEALKPAGYKSYMTGKWHALENPVKRGFDRYFGSVKGAFDYFKPKANQAYMVDDKKFAPYIPENPETFYTTDAFTDKALEFLDEHQNENEPFLLYVAYNAPHYPLQAWPEDIDKYRGKYMKGWDVLREERFKRQKELGIVKPGTKLPPRDKENVAWRDFDRKEDADITMATFAAMVDRVDQNVGRIVAKLEEMGKLDNTLILFFSDNGSTMEGELWDGKNPRLKPDTKTSQAKLGPEWANAGNTPYRKYKRFMYNGGVLSPFIAHWPKGILQKGEIIHERAHLVDLMPTILELAQVTHPENQMWKVAPEGDLKTEWNVLPLSGHSMLPILKGEKATARDYIFNHFQVSRMIMKDNMKLVSDGYDGTVQHMYDYPWELYDMNNDPTELNNLAKQYPELVDEMDAEFRKWIDRADSLNGVRSHKWFQLRFTKEQQLVVDELVKDKRMLQLLEERKVIGLKIVEELKKGNYKIRTGLGMEKIPMSYFGIVNEGVSYSSETELLKKLYSSWDKNIETAEKYCKNKGDIYTEVWKMQEKIRLNLPEYEVE